MTNGNKFKVSRYILDIPYDVRDKKYIILFNTLSFLSCGIRENLEEN